MKNSKDPSFKEDQMFLKNYHFTKMFFLLWLLNKINKKSHLIANKLKQFALTYKAEQKENNVQLDKEYKRNYAK
jgi:amino acid permease